jgi:hypothetical protein
MVSRPVMSGLTPPRFAAAGWKSKVASAANSSLSRMSCPRPKRYSASTISIQSMELHFGRSAQRLHVTTGRVSQTIRQLERRVGVPLFERASRRVELTAAAHRNACGMGKSTSCSAVSPSPRTISSPVRHC